jgi:hypothetical protein
LLKDALGYALFTDFETNLDEGVLIETPDLKWDNLINGCTYTKSGDTYKWVGLAYTEGVNKKSLLADFVYYYWLEQEASKNTGVGVVIQQSKSAINVNISPLLTKYWNSFIEQYQSYSYDSNYVSLLEFLDDNSTDYPDAPLFTYKLKNEFGI